MKMISLITVYNHQALLDEMIASAKIQINVDVDFVMIDNRKGSFKSAASALNYGMSKAKGEVLVFLHQDIEFLSESVLSRIYDFAIEHKSVLFGAAGVKSKEEDKGGSILTSMYTGPDKVKNTTLSKPTGCFTLDECLIACHKNCVSRLTFDEKVCDGWHLYGADLCLQAQLIADLSVMVVPMDDVWHKSNGNADKSYMQTQCFLAKKYKDHFKVINTTNGFQYTNPLKRIALNIYRKIRYR